MIGPLLSVAISLLYALSCLGLGYLVDAPLRRWRGHSANDSDMAGVLAGLASTYLLGVAAYAAVLTILGLLGALDLQTIAFSLIPGWLAVLFFSMRTRAEWRKAQAAIAALRSQPLWVTVIAVLLVLVTTGFAVAAWFTPPKGDAAAFYLVYPRIIAASGTLAPMQGTYESFSMIGLVAEYHFAALMVLADVGAAKLFIIPVALACAALLSGMVANAGGRIVAIVLACAVLLTSGTVNLYMFDGKVDLLSAAFGLAAGYWLVWRPSPVTGYAPYAMSGLFAGLAAVSKFSYVPALGLALLVLLLWRAGIGSERRVTVAAWFRTALVGGLLMAATTLVGWLPQLLKNAALFNAPLAPFFGAAGGEDLFTQVWFSAEATWKIVLTYPLALIFGRYPMQGGGLSFLVLSFLPLLFWGRRAPLWHRDHAIVLALAGLIAVLGWVVLRPSVIAPRYFLAPLLFMIPILVIKTEQLLVERSGPAFLRLGVVGSVLAAIAASCWQLLPLPSALMAAARGEDTTCLLASPECAPLRELSSQAAPGDRVLVATYYAYWLAPSHLQCRDQGNELHTMADQPDLVDWLHRRNFRYAAIDASNYPDLDRKMAGFAASTPDVQLLPIDSPTMHIYAIAPANTAELSCVNAGRDRWVLADLAP